MRNTDDVLRLPTGRHADQTVPGLVLTVRERQPSRSRSVFTNGGRFWSFRYRTPEGKWREIGLGSAFTQSLDSVRAVARSLREQIDKKRSPVVPAREAVWPMSNRAMAKTVNVSPETMNRTMREILAKGEREPTLRVTGRDGKTYPVRRR